jgi:N-acyl-phosphatidylethanolamine-hydrolysing phospholipase D
MCDNPRVIQVWGAAVAVATYLLVLTQCCSAPLPNPDKPHHTKDGFTNIYSYDEPGFLDFLKWRWQRLWKKTPGIGDYRFPLAKNDPAFLRSNREKTTLTWIGHATVFLQVGGKNILTDPHFSERASPFQWIGPKRVVPPGIALDRLPEIDIVVISHDHYDSLDKGSIMRLYERHGGTSTRFFVPLGLKDWFSDLGISNVIELDWWDSHDEDGLVITAVPVHHWSKRGLISQNRTLWAGWVIGSENFRFLFCGDTGYTPLFKEIGSRAGPFDLSAIPIGAYEPRWFMRHHHISPEEAVQVHLDVRSRTSVAIHWGTFILTDEPLDEPPLRIERALKEKGIPGEAFLVLAHGQTIVLDSYKAAGEK